MSKRRSRSATQNCMLSCFVLLGCENHLETERYFFGHLGILSEGSTGRMDGALIPGNLPFFLKFNFITLENRNLLNY